MQTAHDLPRRERLRSRERISELFSQGTFGTSRTVLARTLPSPDGIGHIAFAAGKKLGCAVERNRMRRRLRAAYRIQKDSFPCGHDLVLVAKRGLAEATWQNVMRDVARAVTQAGMDTSGRPPSRHNP